MGKIASRCKYRELSSSIQGKVLLSVSLQLGLNVTFFTCAKTSLQLIKFEKNCFAIQAVLRTVETTQRNISQTYFSPLR